MTRTASFLALLLLLGACDGNPFVDDGGGGGGGGGGGDEDPLTFICDDTGRCLPPGTATPTPEGDIFRREAREGAVGNGYANNVAYDAGTDTFFVDNLGFDADNTYARGAAVGSLGPFQVYENDDFFADSATGAPIGQFTHRAIYAISTTGQTELAIIRTGSYIGYGFGGYLYRRNGGVTLPTAGQAGYTGNYAALRDFNGRGGLEYATGDMTMAIDFEDFDRGAAVQGQVFNRRIFDLDGNDITAAVIDNFNDENDASLTALPTLLFTVGPGTLDANGELTNKITSHYANNRGDVLTFEQGNYYAVLAGPNANEVVGIIVVEATVPGQAATVRETGGFILYRP